MCVCEELLVETLPFPRIQALKLIIFTLFFPVYQWWKSGAAYPEEGTGAPLAHQDVHCPGHSQGSCLPAFQGHVSQGSYFKGEIY